MPTFEKIVYSVLNQVTAGNYTDDTRITYEHVGHVINNVRSVLMRDYYKEWKHLDHSFYQKRCCLDVICEEIKCDNIFSGKKNLVVEIPDLASYLENKAILYFGDPSMTEPYTYVPIQSVPYFKERKFGGSNKSYTLIGNKIHLHNVNIDGLKYACIIAAFDEPIPECGVINGKGDWEYPAPGPIIHKIELLAIQQLSSTFLRNTDIMNDGTETIVGNKQQRDANTDS